MRHRLRDLCLNGFMVVRGSHMKVPFLVRRHVLPGDNQDFLPEAVSESLYLTAPHMQERPGTQSFRFDCCQSSEKIVGPRRLSTWEPVV